MALPHGLAASTFAAQEHKSEPHDNALRDVVALSTLPAIWTGVAPLRIAENLAASVFTMLNPEFVYVSFLISPSSPPLAIAQTGRYETDQTLAEQIGASILTWACTHDPDDLLPLALPGGSETVRIATRAIGLNAEFGVMAAAFAPEYDLKPTDLLLLNVAATQAAVAVQNAKLLHSLQASELRANRAAEELSRRLEELETANAQIRDSRRAALNLMEEAVQARDTAEALNRELRTEIANRKQAEQALRDSEGRLAADLNALRRIQQVRTRLVDSNDLHARLAEILAAAADLAGTPKGNIQIYEPESRRLRIIVHQGFGDRFLKQFLDQGSPAVCDVAAQKVERMIWEDIAAEPALQGTVDLEVILGDGIRAIQSTPLISLDGRLLGLLNNHFSVRHRPSERELRFIDLLARMASDFIERYQADEAMRESEAWLAAQKEAFQAAMNGAPLKASLDILLSAAAKQAGGDTRCAFYVANAEATELRHVTGMSEAYARAVDHFDIGPDSLSCGLAVHRGCTIATADVFQEPRWKPWLWLAEEHGFRGCWSFPIETSSGKIVGTFAMYFREPREATARDHQFAAVLTHTAAIIISRHQEAEERARREEELREAGERLRFMAESMPQKIFTVTVAGDVDYFNQQWLQFTGLNFEQLKGWGWTKIVHPDDLEENVELWRNAIQSGEPFQYIHRLRRADGAYRWHLTRARAMRDYAGQVSMWIGSDTDIDEQKRREVELRRLNDDLKQFAFAASHDLQEPLRMMTSYSQLLLKGYQGNPDPEAAICVDFITRGAQRMRDLLADLLSYTKVTADEEQPSECVDLNAILHGVQQDLASVIETSAAVITSDPLPMLYLHEAHVRQLLQNLISNAIKYKGDSPPRIHIQVTKELSHWRFAVSDNGMGIEPEYHQTIFGVFKRLHGKTIPGTGIGLAICQRVVERYGGRIWVDSTPHEGSTFYFTLPLAKEQINERQTADASDPYVAGRG